MKSLLNTHRTILQRGAVFVAGGLVSYVLNLIPYKLLRHFAGWPHDPAYAASLTWVTVLMFFWNYRVNFPTKQHWKLCASRYVTSVLIAWALNFFSVRLIKEWLPVSVAIFIIGFVIAVLKFGLYHWWVFPHREEVPAL